MSDYNIYCDESCHLEKDHQKVMVLGAIWCPVLKTKEISDELRDVKIKHGLSNNFELKWTKISPAKIDYYLEVVEQTEYLIILRKRAGYFLFWTSYPVTASHRKNKLRKEYQAYINKQGAS